MPTVLYDLHDKVATITLNRPEALNAFDPALYRDLNAAVARFAADDGAWAAVVTGAGGRAFSVGIDVKAMDASVAATGGSDLDRPVRIDLIDGDVTDKPIVAAIAGHCIGDGLGLAMVCDLRLAGESARFAAPEARLGVPATVIPWLATRLIGPGAASELLLTADARDAAWALRTGLVQEVVPDDILLDTAQACAARIASLAPMAVRAMKRIVAKSLVAEFDETVSFATEMRAKALASNDFAEGRRAFVEKRAPVFRGD